MEKRLPTLEELTEPQLIEHPLVKRPSIPPPPMPVIEAAFIVPSPKSRPN
jgi:hypothetical protein